MTGQTQKTHEKTITLQLLVTLFLPECLKGIGALRAMFLPGTEVGMAEAYLYTDIDDEHTYRVWRLYMAGSIHSFKTRRLNVYQSLFVRPDDQGNTGLPLSRMDWYTDQVAHAN